MNTIKNSEQTKCVPFSELRVQQAFMYIGKLFMKVHTNHSLNAVWLSPVSGSTSAMCNFDFQTLVTPVDLTIEVHTK